MQSHERRRLHHVGVDSGSSGVVRADKQKLAILSATRMRFSRSGYARWNNQKRVMRSMRRSIVRGDAGWWYTRGDGSRFSSYWSSTQEIYVDKYVCEPND